MGQRFQVVIKYLENEYIEGKSVSIVKRAMYHNQWCYGRLPIFALSRIVQFHVNAREEYKLNKEQGIYIRDFVRTIQDLMSVDYRRGSIQNFFLLDDSEYGMDSSDNNDGWLLLDFTKEDSIYYSFIAGDETLGLSYDKERAYTPINANKYFNYYKFNQISYYRNNGESEKNINEWLEEIREAIKIINNNTVLLDLIKRMGA